MTLGTYDGANVEIVEQVGGENAYIFGRRVEELDKIRASYDAKALYEEHPRIHRVVDSLVDGTFDDGGTGMFRELYQSLLEGASWHRPDQYFLLEDFFDYQEKRLAANEDYRCHRQKLPANACRIQPMPVFSAATAPYGAMLRISGMYRQSKQRKKQ